MKSFAKKEPSPCSVSDDSPPQRPKRSTCQKNLGITNGLLWREETDLKRALYASLQETRRRNLEDDDDLEEEEKVPSLPTAENGEESPKKAKVHAQRKFAQGSTPNSPVPTPLKVPYVNSSTTELLPYRRPKTEDFLTFLCLRGTSILPPSLDFLNSCSKSDTSSDCRSLSPEPEIKECTNVKEVPAKSSDNREKNYAKHEVVENGVPRKHACKASSKRHPDSSQIIKKTNSTVVKSQKEISIVRKRKSRDKREDHDFLPTNVPSRLKSSCNARTRSSTFHALREKYKKQRLAADKKKLLPVKNTNAPASSISHTRGHATRSQSIKSQSKRNSPEFVEAKPQLKPGHLILNKNKQTRIERKLAIEKRKSLRSAHPTRDFVQKRMSVLSKKTPWLRRAKLVPPIVDVDSDSEPEIISTAPTKKITPVVTPNEQENVSNKNSLSERLRSRRIAAKVHAHLTSRQVLLRKHMQNRLKAKKNILKNKNIKSRTIIKRATKQNIYKKVRKSLVMKTMSLRKDLQNKRVTRSAKHQIEELFWSNPEKRSKAQSAKRIPNSKSDKKRVLSKNFPPSKKQKVMHPVKDLKQTKCHSKEPLKKKLEVVGGTRASKQNTSVSDVQKFKESVKITRSSKVISSGDEKPSTSSLVSNVSLLSKYKAENVSNVKSLGINVANMSLHPKSKTENIPNIRSSGTTSNVLSHPKTKTGNVSNAKNLTATSSNVILQSKSKIENISNDKNSEKVSNVSPHPKTRIENTSVKNIPPAVSIVSPHPKTKIENTSVKNIPPAVSNVSPHPKTKIENTSVKNIPPAVSDVSSHSKTKTASISHDKNSGIADSSMSSHPKTKSENISNVKNLVTIPNAFSHPKAKMESGANLKNISNIKNSGAKSSTINDVKESKSINITATQQSGSLDVNSKHISNRDIHKPSTSTAVLQSIPITFDSEIGKMNLLPSSSTEIKTLNRINNNERDKNDFENKNPDILEEKETNVQNNLNLTEIEKNTNKDISKLIVLNVECDESNLIQKCEPCCSKFMREQLENGEKATENRPSKIEGFKEQNVKDGIQSCKKSLEKKYMKKHDKDHTLSPRKILEKCQKLHRKENEKNGKSHKKDSNKEKDSFGTNKDMRKSADKLHRKKEFNKYKHETSSEESDSEKDIKSLSKSINKKEHKEKLDNIVSDCKSNKKSLDKVHKKELNKDKNENGLVKINKSANKLNQKRDKIEKNKDHHESNTDVEKSSIKLDEENERNENFKDQLNNKIASKISNEILLSESDDDSDYDITLDHFIKLKSESKSDQKSESFDSIDDCTLKKELNTEVTVVSNANKELKIDRKETDKELHKFKKEGDSSKHKKDNSKNKGHDKESKAFRKEDKLNKKEAEKSLAKLLKKEREREKFILSKKEDKEKSKHKRDSSSSSKSSKRDFEKDGLKLSKKEMKESCSSEKQIDINPEFLEGKKDKSSKKESAKLSRSNSYDEAKSPKKKKKHNEFRDIEKIKKIFSKSSILNEISGFKEFKRRISSDKSEYKKHLSKSKKRKKLALLKEKKLSKKLSSKLLRKYSKKKGLKSKKNKLKKKELRKELKFTDLANKIHSKSKKQKHKAKAEHHRKDSQEKLKSCNENTLVSNGKINSSTSENSQFVTKLRPESHVPEQVLIASEPLSSNTQICTNETSTAPSFIIENVAEVVPTIETISADVSQPIPADLVFSATDDLQTIMTSEFSGVFDEAFPSGTILLATRDSISQVPVHFIQDLSVPKTMADAATNTGDDDLDESINAIPEHLRSEEMSVGTQTVTPAGSPSPTVEMRTLVPSQAVESPLADKNKDECVKPSTSTSSLAKVPEKIPLPTVPTTGKNKSTNAVNNSLESSSPKVKKRTFVKKAKIPMHFSLSNSEPFPLDTARMVAAPVYYPTMEEFRDPLEYICKIHPEAGKYGICKIVPPSSFKPECKVNDDMRFTAHNQYVHKMLYRWGPNVQHTACIKKHLKSQKVKLEQAPLIGGIELDISKFYHTVQQFGGLQQVIEKKKWQRVADVIHVPKTAQDRVTKLYDAYCKYLVSYDTLPADEKQKIEEEVLTDHERHVRLRNNAKDLEKEEEEADDDENNDCVTKGRSMSLSNFFRIARNTMSMWFKNDPSPEEVEHEFWKVVTERQHHVVVHAGNIDSSVYQSGFPCSRNSPFAKHSWNLKVLTNNNSSILKCMGPVSGITIPTLHVGMLFTTGCWYRDPHSLPWIEYLHTGASKIWYGVPANGCEKFRNGMKKIMPEYCTNNPIWLPSDTAMVPPDLLVKYGASLSRTIQNSGQFVVIFPESFTSTICCGYCVSESVYFAPTPWLDLATKAFQDIRNSCEPPAFSLERLLFSIANDPKTQPETLEKILPMVKEIRTKELNLRSQLSDLGLKQCERIPLLEVKDKKKKSRGIEDESEQECEVCRSHCYVSMVVYPQEDSIYCLPHALEHIPKKNLRSSKLMYTYDENDLDELVKKIDELISSYLHKLNAKKKSPKKKVLIPSEKSATHNKKENSS